MKYVIFTTLLLANFAFAQGPKIPPSVAQEAQGLQDRFAAALLDECPDAKCYSSGCIASQFQTLDTIQDSSLPGLETDVKGSNTGNVQFKLSSARCEFSHEPSLEAAQIQLLRQRLAARVKTVGVQIEIIASKLKEKVQPEPEKAPEPIAPVVPKTMLEMLAEEMFPFLPWIVLLFSILLFSLALIWGIRKLGKTPVDKNEPVSLSSKLENNNNEKSLALVAEPSSQMLILRMAQLKDLLNSDEKLVEYTLRPHFEQKDFDELCLFLRHFGPGFLSQFKKRAEFSEILGELSDRYSLFDKTETASEHWQFLERLERKMISAKVKINNQPLTDEFAFLGSISVDELVGLVKGESDLTAVAAIAYAPVSLREEFFAIAPPLLTAKIVEQLTKIDRLPDSIVREAAQRLRDKYNDHSKEYKTVKVNKTPLIEIALNHLSEDERKKLVDDLRHDDPEAVKKLAPAIFLDECLKFLSGEVITETFLEVAPKDAAAYLNKFEWKQQILEKMNQRLKDGIEKYLNVNYKDEAGAVHARIKIAKFLRHKASIGLLDLDAINRKILG